jgi:hypothetical protein
MDKITIFVDELNGKEYVTIDHGNEQYTSMLKSTYEAMQAEQSTPSVIDEA